MSASAAKTMWCSAWFSGRKPCENRAKYECHMTEGNWAPRCGRHLRGFNWIVDVESVSLSAVPGTETETQFGETTKENAMTTISVNGRDVETAAESLTGAELVALAGKHPGCTVTVHYRREDDKRGRAPVPDDAVDVRPGMIVSVADTSRA